MSVLIWVQTVCKGYQQAEKELKISSIFELITQSLYSFVIQRNSERMRTKVYQNRTAQEFREAFIAHSFSRAPNCLFSEHAGGKVSLSYSFYPIKIVQFTFKVPITTEVVCFCHLLKCFSSFLTNSVDPDQTAPLGAV